VRLFLAVDLDDSLRNKAAGAIRTLTTRLGPRARGGIKWVSPENLHITMHFFGYVQDAAAIVAALERSWSMSPFSISLTSAGCFPPSGMPRVAWIGIDDGRDALSALHREAQDRIRPLGLADPPDSRPFSPHLTIARVRRDATPALGRALRRAIEDLDASGRTTVDYLTLYESKLSSAGPTYSKLATFRLCGT
jgi:RNA 2',3'-cyclic 3'-phosphodiesterase